MSATLYRQLVRWLAPERLSASRREFIRASSLAAAGALIGCSTSRPPPMPSGRRRRVVIVGAGLSGLAAAWELKNAHVDVSVLEARQRVGGRVLTWRNFIRSKTIEAGAELIGSNHPLWQHYARQFGLHMRPMTDDDSPTPVVLDGLRLDTDEARRLLTELDAAFEEFTKDAREINAFEPWTSPNATALDRLSLGEKIRQLNLGPRTQQALETQMASDNAAECDRQSYLGNLALIRGGGLADYWTQSEVFRCEEGNDALATEFTRRLGRNTVRLGQVVETIEVRDAEVHVTTAGGEKIAADHLILAVPPSVWSKIRMTPAWPAGLNPQMGSATKYFAQVRSPYWAAGLTSPNGLTNGALSQTWDATDHQTGPGTVLVGFSGGSAADQSRSAWRADQGATLDSEFEQLLPGFTSHCTARRFMDWPADPWVQAGYSFPAPGELTRIGAQLQAGFGPILLAGEHTCPAFAGYMEGALQSGVRAARSLLRHPTAPGQRQSALQPG